MNFSMKPQLTKSAQTVKAVPVSLPKKLLASAAAAVLLVGCAAPAMAEPARKGAICARMPTAKICNDFQGEQAPTSVGKYDSSDKTRETVSLNPLK